MANDARADVISSSAGAHALSAAPMLCIAGWPVQLMERKTILDAKGVAYVAADPFAGSGVLAAQAMLEDFG
jgi:hypothetical protein